MTTASTRIDKAVEKGHFDPYALNPSDILEPVPGQAREPLVDPLDPQLGVGDEHCVVRVSRHERQLAAGNGADFIPAVLEHAGQHLEIGGGVVNDQDVAGVRGGDK